MAGLLNDISMAGLKGGRESETPRTVYNNNPMGVSLRNSGGNVIPYEGLLGEQGEYEKSLPDTMGQFIDPAHGLRAGIRNLRMQAKSLGDKKSLYDLIERWHGKGRGKQKTNDYASMVAKSMGDSRNPKDIKIGDIDFNDSVVKGKMANAMIGWEGGGSSLPQHIIDMAIDMEQPKRVVDAYGTVAPEKDYSRLGLWDLIKETVTSPENYGLPAHPIDYLFGSKEPSPQQQYEAARMNRPPLTPPQMAVPDKSMMYPQPKPQMAPIDKSMMYPQPKRSLQQVAQTAQAQPALNPFPWLKEVSGSYGYPSPPDRRWV